MRRLGAYVVVLGLAATAIIIGVDLLVETDEERISSMLDHLQTAATSGDADRLGSLLDLEGDGFQVVAGRYRGQAASGDMEAVEDLVAQGSEWLKGGALHFEGVTINVSGARAHAYLRVVVRRDGADEEVIPVDLSLRRTGDDWRVTRLRALTGGASGRSAQR